LLVLTVLFVVGLVYFEYRSTTYTTADGACQSLTVEDDCY
ncbi:MAG: hypothetical protein RL333_544, partial [Pseudomonadota bacterium]